MKNPPGKILVKTSSFPGDFYLVGNTVEFPIKQKYSHEKKLLLCKRAESALLRKLEYIR